MQRTNPLAVLREISGADLVISGGGGLPRCHEQQINSILPVYSIYGEKLNKKVMFYANGVGPVYRDMNKRMIKLVGNKVDFITVRDEKSSNNSMIWEFRNRL